MPGKSKSRSIQGRPAGGRVGGVIPSTSPLSRPCPNTICGAPVGERCRTWKIEKGEPIYILKHNTNFHKERRTQRRPKSA